MTYLAHARRHTRPIRLPIKIASLLPGIALTLIIAWAASELAKSTWASHLGLSTLTLAIVGGMVLGNTVYPGLQDHCNTGVEFSKARLLRLGIILFGLRITFQDIAIVGFSGVLIDLLVLSSTFILAVWLGRRCFGLDGATAILIGAGSSICGAAAVLGTGPVTKGNSEQVAVAVATVVIFGTISMFLYPALYPLLASWGVSDAAYGVYVGSTMHEVAQVVVAGQAISDVAASQAVISKMIRVMMLAPFLLILSVFLARRQPGSTGNKKRMVIPWFALGFIIMAAINSTTWLPQPLTDILLEIDNLALAMAMAALGLTTHVSVVRKAGHKPMILAALLFVWLLLGGGGINALLGGWLT